jgi:hypothetical protein
MSESNELVITIDHVQKAFDWITEAETYMPDIFKSMTSGGDSNVMHETWYFVYQLWMKENQPIAEHRIYNFLQDRVPAHNVERIVDVMVKAKVLEKKLGSDGTAYQPKAKRV